MRFASHTETGYPANKYSKSEARQRSRFPNNSYRLLRNLEERNVGTNSTSPKQVLTRTEDINNG